jgi:hypothetical protein
MLAPDTSLLTVQVTVVVPVQPGGSWAWTALVPGGRV